MAGRDARAPSVSARVKDAVTSIPNLGQLRPLYVDGDDDDGGLDDERPRVGDAVHHEARRDYLHDERADERADDGRAPARQGSAADDRRGDGVELYVEPDLLRVARAEPRRLDQSRET